MSASVLAMSRVIDIITPMYIGLNLPIAVQEMVVAVWLIIRGFNPSAVASASQHWSCIA
jgi:hypothetical protein